MLLSSAPGTFPPSPGREERHQHLVVERLHLLLRTVPCRRWAATARRGPRRPDAEGPGTGLAALDGGTQDAAQD
ncbi:hypothetical protein ACFWSB_05605, partial [Streptomyces albidoflavus]